MYANHELSSRAWKIRLADNGRSSHDTIFNAMALCFFSLFVDMVPAVQCFRRIFELMNLVQFMSLINLHHETFQGSGSGNRHHYQTFPSLATCLDEIGATIFDNLVGCLFTQVQCQFCVVLTIAFQLITLIQIRPSFA
ncbi:hypothetical protein HRR86_001120 [Exophiala dermatitidis]|nr:hypothetical protein HRR73_002217 [Exophiala dermatitidis]KAJ4536803.1 hypothetical protein HRR76_004829 [Exophiala dermatitidis]KAJ4572088.1 hypothetical protein HRR79_003294 [Exophiala dermatitidis]KAJ4586562.1 hypothetical protein HRR82_002180 [Exophiala dermatitidis]KAJ4604297.1 hypothetical protein HRR84_001376 [Exophiala dermatitidis]